ncbi:hypothetical protein T458_24440 [Brevibacillus panacihumi W25]|uniref:CYTH domain-containing protein n=1 Tax=Brevibacillus panacihumi W25 TaxID=1408254 RepID=V6M2Q9_9BACL|nr:CYTH domain-containing protein [Brevibacillus panacihumi]EST52170.1 hypothetical protein T458_24440 [Brevibacillus panacihumi W25]
MEIVNEQEYKRLLNADDFNKLANYLDTKYEKETVIQTNYYFDTYNFCLQKKKVTLRIREKQGNFQICLKQKMEERSLTTSTEIKRNLSIEEAVYMLLNNRIPVDVVHCIAEKNVNPYKIRILGSLNTKRTNYVTDLGILSLDHSLYFGKHDYEIELETSESEFAENKLMKLLKKLEIDSESTVGNGKYSRFVKEFCINQ